MNRIEIEIKLNRDRAWLLETLSQMSEADLYEPRTPSEHDPESTWSFADHFVHTTLIERNWNDMFRRHLAGEPAMQRTVSELTSAAPAPGGAAPATDAPAATARPGASA